MLLLLTDALGAGRLAAKSDTATCWTPELSALHSWADCKTWKGCCRGGGGVCSRATTLQMARRQQTPPQNSLSAGL